MKYYTACFSFLFFSSMLFSQEKPDRKDTTVYKLHEIVITAERKAHTILESPLAISVIDYKDLAHTKASGLDKILSTIPGVFAQSRYGNQDIRLTIRGFGARGAGERSNTGTTRGIRVLTDGFPETEPDGRTSLDLVDLSSAGKIEVVRSNASALWGNASGGVVNITSYTSFDRPFINLQSTFGSFGFRQEHISVGTYLDEGKFFFSLANTSSDGWRDHSNNSQTVFNTTFLSHVGGRTFLGVYLRGTTNLFKIPGPLTQAQFDSDSRQAQHDTMSYNPTYVQRDERRFNRIGRIGVTLTHDINESNRISAMAFVSPKFLQRSERNTFRDFTRYHVGGNMMYTNSFNINPSLRSVLQVGFDEAYQDGAILFYNLLNGQRGNQLLDNKREGANNIGAFVQEELTFSEKLVALFGGRYDNITYSYESFLNPKLNETKSFQQFTPKAGITYRFTPTHSLYANLGGGVEVPAGNETNPPSTFGQDTVYAINPLLEPIKSTTIEIGTKHILSFAEKNIVDAFAYEVAAYWIEVKDDIIPYRDGRFYFTAGRTRRLGVEFGLNSRFVNGISLHWALTLSQNTYQEYRIDSVHYKNPGTFADFSNNKMAGVPEMFFNLKLRYVPTFFEKFFIEVGIQRAGKYFADDANTIEVEGYSIMNASAGIDEISLLQDMFRVHAYVGVNNITDKKHVASAFINPDRQRGNDKPIYLEPGLPGNFVGSLTLVWKF